MAVRTLTLLCLLVFAPCAAIAGDEGDRAPEEIEYLITAIGDSSCEFVRNGKRHDAEEAERHIRMKYRRAKRHATTAERFIKRLASHSSMSRRPYLMDCPGSEPVPSGDWLAERLSEYRARQP
jgi:hypothetical protein